MTEEAISPPIEAMSEVTSDGWTVRHWPHENMLSLKFAIADHDDAEGEYSFEGWISFDGCIHWRTDPHCFAHACEPADLDKLKRAFEKVRELAAIRLPDWCG